MASGQKRGANSFMLAVKIGFDSKGKRKNKTKTLRIKDQSLLKTKKKLNDNLQSEFLKDWQKKYAEKVGLSEQTLDVYLIHLNNHILPALGHMATRSDKADSYC